MTKKAKFNLKVADKEESFFSKTATNFFNKLGEGTPVKISIQENNFADQFVGDYIVKGLKDEEPEPEPSHDCPQGQHWDEAQGKCVPDLPPQPHDCPVGQHWDENLGKCVDNEEPTPNPEPSPTGTLWDSNKDGKWNDGNKRVLNTKQNGQKPDDKSIFMAASGNPELIIDGNGVAHLHAGTGGVDNLSLKLVSRHQEGGDGPNRGGGEGFAIARNGWDSKREDYHNVHASLGNGKLPKSIADNTWHHVYFSCKFEGSSIRLIGKVDGDQVCNVVDKNPPEWFNKDLLNKNSYFWIRLNNADHGRMYIMAINTDSALELDFMFEPSKNSIALRNVVLNAI